MTVKQFFGICILVWAFLSSAFAAPVDCDGDCSHNQFQKDVLPNELPAVELQFEFENITRKGGVSRSPAVEPPEPEVEEETAPVCKRDFVYSEYKKTLKCP